MNGILESGGRGDGTVDFEVLLSVKKLGLE